MSYADAILPEFDQEMANTRKVLERIPADKFDWKAHPKLNTIGWNANHLVEIPGWVAATLSGTSWDFAPPGGERYVSPALTTTPELLALFDKNVADARRALAAVRDEDLGVEWSLLYGGSLLFKMPRAAVMRTFILSHMIHHRAHLCVYLRLNDVPVPGMYGPSGDE